MKVIAADSASAQLDETYRPRSILASAAILTEAPYLKPNICEVKPLFKPADDRSVLMEELNLCLKLLAIHRADEVHIDVTTSGTVDLLSSSLEQVLASVPIRARKVLSEVVLNFVEEVKRLKVKVPCLLIGKESVPVRLAELTAGAYGVYYAMLKVLKEGLKIFVGLPRASKLNVAEGSLWLESLLSWEVGVRGCSVEGLELQELALKEYPNPVAAGFRVVEISLKG